MSEHSMPIVTLSNDAKRYRALILVPCISSGSDEVLLRSLAFQWRFGEQGIEVDGSLCLLSLFSEHVEFFGIGECFDLLIEDDALGTLHLESHVISSDAEGLLGLICPSLRVCFKCARIWREEE